MDEEEFSALHELAKEEEDDEFSALHEFIGRDMAEEEEDDEFSALHDMWITRSLSKSELKAQGVEWRRGRWTPKELKLLKKNVKDFLMDKGIKDPAQIIFGKGHDATRSQFFRHIARNIQRPLFAVYRKVCREFDVYNYVHRWSKELEKQLLSEHKLHGNKWVVIGRSLGVSANAARDKYRLVSNRTRKGEWLPEEEDMLMAAMKRNTTEDDLAVCPSATWEQVATHVRTRNGVQCRKKWLFNRWPGHGQSKRWSYQDDLILLTHLKDEKNVVEDEDEVDWSQLSVGWESVGSAHFLRMKWATLRRHVPGYSLKSFEDNLDYLVDHLVPALERRFRSEIVTDSDSDEESIAIKIKD